VLDDLLSRATAAVARRVLDLFADLLLAPAFPQHGQGREVPVLDARHEPVGRVRRLMAGLARLRGDAMAVLSADNERHMNGPGIALPGGLVLMAVDASRVHDDARDRLERPGGGGVRAPPKHYLSAELNKPRPQRERLGGVFAWTDRNDARGIEQMMRAGL